MEAEDSGASQEEEGEGADAGLSEAYLEGANDAEVDGENSFNESATEGDATEGYLVEEEQEMEDDGAGVEDGEDEAGEDEAGEDEALFPAEEEEDELMETPMSGESPVNGEATSASPEVVDETGLMVPPNPLSVPVGKEMTVEDALVGNDENLRYLLFTIAEDVWSP